MLTSQQINSRYDNILEACRQVFAGKGMEYGPTWVAFRWGSLCDQLWIKAKRIRQLEESQSKIPETAEVEYMALINYAIIFLMRLQNASLATQGDSLLEDISRVGQMGEQLAQLYDKTARQAFDLYLLKNHDYNNAWQEMDVRSITDMIIVKILRMRHIIAAAGDGLRAQDVDGQLHDIINYSVFALIMLGAGQQ